MPIKIPDNLPACKILKSENIFVMPQKRAVMQDIRPLKIGIVNLMPTKIVTETQLLRLLGNTPLQVEVELIKTDTYQSKNTSREHLTTFYKTFDEVRHEKLDGLVITGAPVETMEFEQVEYWDELVDIMEWSKKNVTSTMHICWGAQAGLYYHYGVGKKPLAKKLSGVYSHKVNKKNIKLLRGFDEEFYAPHSRYTTIDEEAVKNNKKLTALSTSKEAGIYIVSSKDGKQIFVTGHSEYDEETLALEYRRDVERGINPSIPVNYFPGDNVTKKPKVRWRSHANLLFCNWLNYYVYQQTPYDLDEIGKE